MQYLRWNMPPCSYSISETIYVNLSKWQFFSVKYGCIRNTEAPVNKKKNLSSVSTKTNRIKYSRIYVANGHSMCNGPQIFRRTLMPKSTYAYHVLISYAFLQKKRNFNNFFHLFVFLHILIINLSVCCQFRLLFYAFSVSNYYLWFSDVTLDEFLIEKLKNQRPICAEFASILLDIIGPLFMFTFGHIFSKCHEILVDILVNSSDLQKNACR